MNLIALKTKYQTNWYFQTNETMGPFLSGHQMQNSLYKLFEHKCVLEVCVHIHPIMIKIHPMFFF